MSDKRVNGHNSGAAGQRQWGENVDGAEHMDEELEALANPSSSTSLFGKDSQENFVDGGNKEQRVIHRAKRTQHAGVWVRAGEEGAEGGVTNGVAHKVQGGPSDGRKSKQLKHSRGKGGEPKKGGAGGKGVWGKLGSELDELGITEDVNDPNYDSDSQGEYKLEEVKPELTDQEFDKIFTSAIGEYFFHGKTSEVETLLGQLNIGSHAYKLPRMAIQLGLERHNAQRELVSKLISDLYSRGLSAEDIERGFDSLLLSLDDLMLDTPDAHTLVGQFIARCVADDCLAPNFAHSYKGRTKSDAMRLALEKAEVLLTMSHNMSRLDNIWGVGGGTRPTKKLARKMVELLKEFAQSGDLEEALRCLRELEVPHFHHELVYQACRLAIEDSSERVCNETVRLLKYLTASSVITTDQFEMGARRLFRDMPDISLDVPAAHTLLEGLGTKLHAEGVISSRLLHEIPAKGRKRMVSEGDGGKFKPL